LTFGHKHMFYSWSAKNLLLVDAHVHKTWQAHTALATSVVLGTAFSRFMTECQIRAIDSSNEEHGRVDVAEGWPGGDRLAIVGQAENRRQGESGQ
jgi:hypothetical protein